MINVCYSLGEISDVVYTKEIAISIRSICMNTREPIQFFILLDGTINQSVNDCELNDLMNTYPHIVGINYVDCTLPENIEIPEFTLNRYKKASLFRLCLPSLLTKVDKIIYLDADVIFDTNILKLWGNDVQYIAAYYHPIKKCPNHLKKYCKVNHHFCSGIMVMNLKAIREKNIDLFDVPPELYEAIWLDQCILNYWFSYFNTPLWLHGVYHYYGDLKPNKIISRPTDWIYWKYCDCSRHELIKTLTNMPNTLTVYESLRVLPLTKIIIILIKIALYKIMRK